MANEAEYTALRLNITGRNTEALKSLQDVRESLESLKTISDAIKGLRISNIRNQMAEMTSAINELNNIHVDADRINDIAEALDAVENIVKRIGNIADASAGIGEIVQNVNALNAMNAAPQAAQVETLDDPVGEEPSFTGNAMVRGLRLVNDYVKNSFTNTFTGAAKSVNTLFSSLGRIAYYRAIRTVIKTITSSISEGLQNVYQWAKITGNGFAQSMDSMATSTTYLKNSLGAMGAPLINVLSPAIDYLIDKFVALINVINQAFAVLTGSGTWIKAKKQAQEFAAGVKGSAAGAKKSIDLFLASFDELNVMPSKKDSSGGGGGASVPDYSSMFETEKVDSGIANFVNALKKNIRSGDWKGVGTLLGNKVNEVVDSIDFSGAGKSFGYKLNGVIQSGYYMLDTISFYNIANGIAQFINNAINEVDFTFVGGLFVKKLTILPELAIGFFTNLDYAGLAKAFSSFVIGGVNESSKFLNKINWTTVGASLANGLVNFVLNMDYVGMIMALATFIGNAVNGVVDFAIGSVSGLIGSITADVATWLETTTPEEVLNGLVEFIGNLFEGVVGFILDIPQWVNDHIVTPFISGFKFGWDKSGGDMVEKVDGTWDDVKKATGDTWNGLMNFLFGSWNKTSNQNAKTMDLMNSDTSLGLSNISSKTTSAWSGIQLFMGGTTTDISNKVAYAWGKMQSTVSTVWDGIKNVTGSTWNSVSTFLDQKFGGIKINLSSWFTQISSVASNTWAGIKNAIVNPIRAAQDTIQGIVRTIKGFFNFSISWPYIPMPHFAISPSGWKIGDLLKGSIPRLSIRFYESGGFPENGELFMARENGPELLGRIGSRNAVANNDQIVEAVEGGVYRGVRDAMSATVDSGSGNISLVVKLDGSVIYKDFVKRNNKRVAMTGQSDLLF